MFYLVCRNIEQRDKLIKHLKNIFENQSESEIVSPDPHYKLKLSDRLILFGEDKKLNNFISSN